jgi:hypothetical protein
VPLADLARVAHVTGTTVNDVCVTLVAGAVARYLDTLGPAARRLVPGDDDLAWMVPVNLDPPGREPPPELGNHFALVLAVLPHGPGAFPDRLAEVHRRMGRIRRSWEPAVTEVAAEAIALTPSPLGAAVSRFLAAKAVGVLTNVPGPRTPMTLAGARVSGVVGWAPPSGRETLTVCIFSYAGEVTFGFGTDATVLPDAPGLVTAFDAEWAQARGAVPPARTPSRAGPRPSATRR